jgi:hypothetical protein
MVSEVSNHWGPSTHHQENQSMSIIKNIGTTDRAIRGVVGIALIALAITGNLTPWGWLGIVPLATALLSWCPAYTLFGFKTCKD